VTTDARYVDDGYRPTADIGSCSAQLSFASASLSEGDAVDVAEVGSLAH